MRPEIRLKDVRLFLKGDSKVSEHIALYRKWRPMTFSDVVGQEHVTKTLQNEIVSGSIGHAFLFCGGRGTGKTSTARILSRALNCFSPKDGNPCNECEACRGILSGEIMDITEIDAASNNGVDNIRDLRADSKFAAASLKYKVYIIDEVHMLSPGAFNALLKLLEEPPEGIVFILATTETHKVPLTIISRCQRFDFKRITANDITSRLLYVAEKENIKITEGGARLIARAADGALRDALGLLDQCSAASDKNVDEKLVTAMLGLTEKTFLYRVTRRIAENDTAGALSLADEFIASGKSPAKFIDSFIDYFSTLLRYKTSKTVFSDYTDSEKEEIALASNEMTNELMIYCIETLVSASSSLKFTASGRVLLDTAIIKMCNPSYAEGSEAVTLRVAELEKKLESGSYTVRSSEKTKETTEQKQEVKKKKTVTPLTGDFKAIEDSWSDICRDTDNLRLLIALEKCHIRADGGALVITFDDTDSIMIDILDDEGTKNTLSDLIEKHTGLRPDIKLRLESYYDEEEITEDNDPLNSIVLPGSDFDFEEQEDRDEAHEEPDGEK